MTQSPVHFYRAGATSDIDDDEVLTVSVEGRTLAVYKLAGEFFATDGICTHSYALLGDGSIDGDCIECPLHGGAFDIRTGKAIKAPCSDDLVTYPCRVEGETLMVGLPE